MTAAITAKTLNKEDLMYLEGFVTAYNTGQLRIPAKTKSIAHCAKMRLYRAAKKLLGSDDLIRQYPDLFEARQETSVAVKEIDGTWYIIISRVDSTEFNTNFREAMRSATAKGGTPAEKSGNVAKDAQESLERMKKKLAELAGDSTQDQVRAYLGD